MGRKYWAGDVSYNGYNHSYISSFKGRCEDFYRDNIPNEYKHSDILVTLDEGYGCPVFLPTYAQVDGGFSYYNAIAQRVFTAKGETIGHYWVIQYSDDAYRFVYPDGSFDAGNPVLVSSTPVKRIVAIVETGFRPHLAIKRQAFA